MLVRSLRDRYLVNEPITIESSAILCKVIISKSPTSGASTSYSSFSFLSKSLWKYFPSERASVSPTLPDEKGKPVLCETLYIQRRTFFFLCHARIFREKCSTLSNLRKFGFRWRQLKRSGKNGKNSQNTQTSQKDFILVSYSLQSVLSRL